jgi:hypothetical protein
VKTWFVAAFAALACAMSPAVSRADAPAWLNLTDAAFPARVVALDFSEYRVVDVTHPSLFDGWSAGMSFSRPAMATLGSSCASVHPGAHVPCIITIDQLVCGNADVFRACTMTLEYDRWIDQYACQIDVAGATIEMRYCPEVQFSVDGSLIGPRSFQATPAVPQPPQRWITVRNNEAEPLDAVYLQFNCCGATNGLLARLLDVDVGDSPILPGQERRFALPRSLIGSVPAKDPNVIDRDQIDLTRQCAAFDVDFHYLAMSQNLGATDICKTAVLETRPVRL